MKLLKVSRSIEISGLLAVCLMFMIGCRLFPFTTEQVADRKVRLGKYDVALSLYNKLLLEYPENADLHNKRGHTLVELGDCALAASDFSKSIDLDPRNAAGYNNYAWVLSTCPDLNRDGDKAVELAQKAIDLAPDTLRYLNTLAVAYAESGDFKQAVSLMEKFIYKLEKKYTREKIDKDVYLALESFKVGKPWRDDNRK